MSTSPWRWSRREACGVRAEGPAWDLPDQGTEREFGRKVRTLSGNYQLLQLQPWLLTGENPFASSLSATSAAPDGSVRAGGGTDGVCLVPQAFYRGVLFLQLAFYALVLRACGR